MALASEVSLWNIKGAEELKKMQGNKVDKNLSILGYALELTDLYLFTLTCYQAQTDCATGWEMMPKLIFCSLETGNSIVYIITYK